MADTLIPMLGGKPFQVVVLKGSPYTYHLRHVGESAFCGKKPGKTERAASHRAGWHIYSQVPEGRQHMICARCLSACEDAGAHKSPWLWTDKQRENNPTWRSGETVTFDQWWYDYKIKHGLKDSREVVAMAAWQAALATQRAEPLPPQMLEALDITREAVDAQIENNATIALEALALLRELNDALWIPAYLQPRVDAILDVSDAAGGNE